MNKVSSYSHIFCIAVVALIATESLVAMNVPQGKHSVYRRSLQNKKLQNVQSKKPFYTPPTFEPRGLLIFLDASEVDSLGANSSQLLTAIYQGAGPIIASATLLCNLFECLDLSLEDKRIGTIKYKEISNASKNDINMRANIWFIYREALDKHYEPHFARILKGMLAQSIYSTMDNWVIKKISDEFYLLIPRAYLLSEFGTSSLNSVEYTADYDLHEVSELELQLGLKVNHMQTVTANDFKRKSKQEESTTLRPRDLMEADFLFCLDRIFCSRNQYKKELAQPIWSIYISGHGKTHILVAGLTPHGFSMVLNFLESKINTQLLVYASCYAAGANGDLIYRDVTGAIQKTYSYPIIVKGLNDTATISAMPTLNRTPEIRFDQLKTRGVQFDKFLRIITKQKIDYNDAMNMIKIQNVNDNGLVTNTPQIKLPGLEWFSVVGSDDKIVSLGKIFAQTRDPQKPLDITQFALAKNKAAKPEIILLYAYDIPFELVINAESMKAIVSMVPGSAIHKIKSISSSKALIKTMINWLLVLDQEEKLFFVECIEDANKLRLENVIVHKKDDQTRLFFTKNGELFTKNEKRWNNARIKVEQDTGIMSRISSYIWPKPKKEFVYEDLFTKIVLDSTEYEEYEKLLSNLHAFKAPEGKGNIKELLTEKIKAQQKKMRAQEEIDLRKY